MSVPEIKKKACMMASVKPRQSLRFDLYSCIAVTSLPCEKHILSVPNLVNIY